MEGFGYVPERDPPAGPLGVALLEGGCSMPTFKNTVLLMARTCTGR
jgi:hypothetical protein